MSGLEVTLPLSGDCGPVGGGSVAGQGRVDYGSRESGWHMLVSYLQLHLRLWGRFLPPVSQRPVPWQVSLIGIFGRK